MFNTFCRSLGAIGVVSRRSTVIAKKLNFKKYIMEEYATRSYQVSHCNGRLIPVTGFVDLGSFDYARTISLISFETILFIIMALRKTYWGHDF